MVGGVNMSLYDVHYMGNYGSVVIKRFKGKNECDVQRKAEKYCDNIILNIEEVA